MVEGKGGYFFTSFKYKSARMTAKNFFLSLLVILFVVSCSNDSNTNSQENKSDGFTKKTAEKAVQHIQVPIDKAKAVQNELNKHTDQVERVNEQ